MKLFDLLYWIIGLDQPSGSTRTKPNPTKPDVADTVVAIHDEATDIAADNIEEELCEIEEFEED